MNVEPSPKVFLQNKLGKSQSKLAELEPVVNNKRECSLTRVMPEWKKAGTYQSTRAGV